MALVVVAFRPDLPLLTLQARSFALHLEPEEGRRIYVVNNDHDQERFRRAFEREVLPLYGPHAPQVELLPLSACLAGFEDLRGWRRQQLLKWAVARIVPSSAYLALDCKNLLIRRWRMADILAPGGRMRLARRRPGGSLEASTRYFLADAPAPDFLANISTPYPMVCRHVLGMMSAIEAREGRSAFRMLAERGDCFEFALYYAYLLSIGEAGLYDLQRPPFSMSLWFRPGEKVDFVMESAGKDHVRWFGLHRRAALAPPELQERVAALLAERGLFADAAAAREFLAGLPLPEGAATDG
jgi:hypothetical protein